MTVEKEIIRIGSSLAVIIPSPVARAVGLKKGDVVALASYRKKIEITPVQKLKPVDLWGIAPSKGAKYGDFRALRHDWTRHLAKKWKNT